MAQTDNAITRRADQMQQMWRNFLENPTARTCYWVMEPEAMRMMDVFYEVNAGDAPNTPDLFFRLETPFEDISTYGSMLSAELSRAIEGEREALTDAQMTLNWHSKHGEDPSNRAIGFLRNFFKLAHALDLEDAVVVAYFAPKAILRREEWERWCFNATQLDLPANLRLMFVEAKGSETLLKLAKQYPQRMIILRPELDMSGAMRELMSETGNQTDKGTDFQKAFFELSQSIVQKNMDAMKTHAEKAIVLSRSMGYPHLEVGVLCATANGFLANNQPKIAITAYDEAFRVAQASKNKPLIPQVPDFKVDESSGSIFDQLTIQVLFSKGGVFLSYRSPKYAEALSVYQQADALLEDIIAQKLGSDKENIDFEKGGVLLLHRVEALRLIGFCLEGLGQGQKALETYYRAVDWSEKWTLEIRQNSTLPFIGQAMMNICHKFAMKREFHAVLMKMNLLLGDGWDKKLPKK
jgi:tetratricopeptide (TPR) repeat protein